MKLFRVYDDGAVYGGDDRGIPHDQAGNFVEVWTENEEDAPSLADARPTCRHLDYSEDQDGQATCLTCGLRLTQEERNEAARPLWPDGSPITKEDRARIKETIKSYDELEAAREEIAIADEETRLRPYLVRTEKCRFTTAAQYLPYLVGLIERNDDSIRDITPI